MDKGKLKEKIREKIGIELCSVCSDSGLCLKDNGYCSCAEEADLALTAIEDAGYVLMPKDQILRKMSQDMTERKAGNSRLVYNKVTRTIDTVRTTDIDDVCQADAGAKGETVSAPMEPLQSHLSAKVAAVWAATKAVAKELWHNDPDRPFTDEAWERELHFLDKWRDEPNFIRDNLYAAKCFRVATAALWAANSQSQIEEAQRADTERAENSESSLTHQIPSPPQDMENGDV